MNFDIAKNPCNCAILQISSFHFQVPWLAATAWVFCMVRSGESWKLALLWKKQYFSSQCSNGVNLSKAKVSSMIPCFARMPTRFHPQALVKQQSLRRWIRWIRFHTQTEIKGAYSRILIFCPSFYLNTYQILLIITHINASYDSKSISLSTFCIVLS